jgi:hypothetical protein
MPGMAPNCSNFGKDAFIQLAPKRFIPTFFPSDPAVRAEICEKRLNFYLGIPLNSSTIGGGIRTE